MDATAACSFAKEVGLSVEDTRKLPLVSDGANAVLWYDVAVKILGMLFPLATFGPDSVSYETKKCGNW